MSRYYGLYPNTLKLLDMDDKKRIRRSKKKNLPSRYIF